ncbi:MAG: AIR synthase related protein [Planctomycetaceae bacterium]
METHNHPSAIEPYGGANTGLGGVIRDPLGTGLGAKPVCSTDVFCFASPDTPYESLPPGVLHPRAVMKGSSPVCDATATAWEFRPLTVRCISTSGTSAIRWCTAETWR